MKTYVTLDEMSKAFEKYSGYNLKKNGFFVFYLLVDSIAKPDFDIYSLSFCLLSFDDYVLYDCKH